jgi:serine/threonine protein kinase
MPKGLSLELSNNTPTTNTNLPPIMNNSELLARRFQQQKLSRNAIRRATQGAAEYRPPPASSLSPEALRSPIEVIGNTIIAVGSAGVTLEVPLEERLGVGSEAVISRTTIDGSPYAVKQYTLIAFDSLVNSINAHYIASNKLNPNPNIISLHSIICSRTIRAMLPDIPESFFYRMVEEPPTDRYCNLIFEYIPGTNLEAYRISGNKERIALTTQLFSAVHYLHGRNIAHRDIKPSNIMITPDRILKIIDLGSACFVGRCAVGSGTKEYSMSKYYTNPDDHTIQNNYAFNNDIYSCLLTVYFMFSSVNKFVGTQGFTENRNRDYERVPAEFRGVLSRYVAEVETTPIVTLTQCNEFIDRFLTDLHNVRSAETGGKSKTRRSKKKGSKKKLKTRVLRGGANELIDTVLSKDHKNVEWALIDLIQKNDGNIGTPSDPLVDRVRSTSGKTPLFFTIRNKTTSILGFGGSSNCSGKYVNVPEGRTLVFPQFNQDTYILLRLLGARVEHRDAKGKGILDSDGCGHFNSDINIAEGRLQKMAIIYNQMGSVNAAVQHPSFAVLKSLMTGLRGKRIDSGFLNSSLKNMLDNLYRTAV